MPALVPVEITPVAAPISSDAPQPASSPPAQRAKAGTIEIELGGSCRVRIDRDVDVEALQRVLELLRRR
jgi:transposase